MRIGTMIKQLLEEVRAAPLGEASRNRLRDPRHLDPGTRGRAGPELREELERLALPFSDETVPSDAELRIAPGPAGRLAGGSVPRDPDSAVRPADGRPGAARAHARPGCAATRDGSARRTGRARARHRAVPVAEPPLSADPYRDPRRLGRVSHLRCQDPLAEEDVPQQGRGAPSGTTPRMSSSSRRCGTSHCNCGWATRVGLVGHNGAGNRRCCGCCPASTSPPAARRP